MKNTSLVCVNFNVANQRRIAPNAKRVVRESAGADEFAIVVAELEAGHLRTSIDAVDSGTGRGIPEMNVSIVGSAASGQKVELPGTPTQSLDGRTMIGLLELRRTERSCIPDRDEVVVSPCG